MKQSRSSNEWIQSVGMRKHAKNQDYYHKRSLTCFLVFLIVRISQVIKVRNTVYFFRIEKMTTFVLKKMTKCFLPDKYA
jgi:hypothetical protein